MSVYANHGAWDESNSQPDASGEWVLRYEKKRPDLKFSHIDYGAIALRREVIAALPAGQPHDLAVIQAELARAKLLRATEARDRFFEIGSPEGLETLDRWLVGHASSPNNPRERP
jgi:NDP-sugar pyrophosphorylase family protein